MLYVVLLPIVSPVVIVIIYHLVPDSLEINTIIFFADKCCDKLYSALVFIFLILNMFVGQSTVIRC
jgi:hypothetical protein